jgi:hypothetical protein
VPAACIWGASSAPDAAFCKRDYLSIPGSRPVFRISEMESAPSADAARTNACATSERHSYFLTGPKHGSAAELREVAQMIRVAATVPAR